jgi:hypothetical protein
VVKRKRRIVEVHSCADERDGIGVIEKNKRG